MNRDGSTSELDRDREDAEDREQLFVQQVAEALGGMGWKPQHPVFGGDATVAVLSNEAIRHLAPRVGAAILAAASAGYWSGGEGYPPPGVTGRALDALRGGPLKNSDGGVGGALGDRPTEEA